MKIVVFGASGRTGSQLVLKAVARGHSVTGFVRDPAKLGDWSSQIRVVEGQVSEDPEQVGEAIADQDAVIVTLGPSSPLQRQLITRSLANIVGGMERRGVERLIVLSALGLGDAVDEVPPLMRLASRTLLRNAAVDKRRSEQIVRRSGLDWTLAYPVALTNAPATGSYRVGERLALKGLPRISRADVADFLLAEAEDPAFSRRVAVLSY
jgi:putative NADH-flavin reductase